MPEPPPAPCHIRPIQMNDLEAYRTLRLDGLLRFPEAFSSDYTEQKDLPNRFWQTRIESSLAGRDQCLYVAETVEGALVGMAGLVRGESRKERHNALLVGVYVQPEFQEQGLAVALIQACLDWGQRQGVAIVKLGVGAYNTPAIQLYQRLGFEQFGNEPMALWVNGEYLDEWQMAKRLS